jgi:hypothetical protein
MAMRTLKEVTATAPRAVNDSLSFAESHASNQQIAVITFLADTGRQH